MMRTLEGLVRAFDSVFVAPSDSPMVVTRRRMLVLWLVVCLVASLPGWLLLAHDPVHWRAVMATGMLHAVSVPALVCLAYKVVPSDAFVLSVIGAQCLALLLADLNAAELSVTRVWPAFVVALDLLLVMQVDHRFACALVVAVLAWLALTQAESAYRMGLYDLPLGLPADHKREVLCGCDKVPCPQSVSAAFGPWVIACFVFCVDFLLTKWLAVSMQRKQRHIEAIVSATNSLAQHLSRMDVEGAAAALQDSAAEVALPSEMNATFRRIILNLRRIRPYLPDTLFDDLERLGGVCNCSCDCGCCCNPLATAKRGCGRAQAVAVTAPPPTAPADVPSPQAVARPPGVTPSLGNAGRTRVTLAFTELSVPQSVWDAEPDAMNALTRVHNKIVRGLVDTCGGYEVRTMGGSFMIAFGEPASAAVFGLRLQEEVACKQWPAELDLSARGPPVKVVVHTGDVDFETNPATGRTDYYGQAVVRAVKLEALAAASCVTVSEEVMEELWCKHNETLKAKPRAITRDAARVPMKARSLSQLDVMLQQRGMDVIDQVVDFGLNADDGEAAHDIEDPRSHDAGGCLLPDDTELVSSSGATARCRSHCIDGDNASKGSAGMYLLIPSSFAACTQDILQDAVAVLDGDERVGSSLRRDISEGEASSSARGGWGPTSSLSRSSLRVPDALHAATVARIEMSIVPGKRRLRSSLSTAGPHSPRSADVQRTIDLPHTDAQPADGTKLQQAFGMFLSAALTCLDRTEGKVVSVCGTAVFTGWNTSFRCTRHVEHSFRFVYLVDQWRAQLEDVPISTHSGVCNGMVSCGAVGTASQRFVGVVGECVKVAEHLCLTAACVRSACLYASLDDAHIDQDVRRCMVGFPTRDLLPTPVVAFPETVYELILSSIASSPVLTKRGRTHADKRTTIDTLVSDCDDADGNGLSASSSSVVSSPRAR